MSKRNPENDWMDALREQVKRTSQQRAADRIGMSSSVVNQVLKGTYKGNLANVEARVRGALMNRTVKCPVLGEISCKRCQDEQDRPFAPTNPARVAVFKACRNGCKHSKHRRES
jgi:hypothetical protein